MKRQYSLAHLTVLGCPPPEMIYIASLAGYDAVGIRPIYMGLPGEPNYDLANLPELLRQTRRALEDTGIRINDIELARIADNVAVKDYEKAFAVGAELGAKHVISSIWTNDRNSYLDKFSELCDLANQYDLTVNLEFVTWANVNNLELVMDVLQTTGKRNVGILLDTLHAHRSGVSPESVSSIPKKLLNFIHICDGPVSFATDRESLIHVGRDARDYPGEGGIDIASYVQLLPPSTVMSIELPNLATVKAYGYAEHARRCLEKTQTYFELKGL